MHIMMGRRGISMRIETDAGLLLLRLLPLAQMGRTAGGAVLGPDGGRPRLDT